MTATDVQVDQSGIEPRGCPLDERISHRGRGRWYSPADRGPDRCVILGFSGNGQTFGEDNTLNGRRCAHGIMATAVSL